MFPFFLLFPLAQSTVYVFKPLTKTYSILLAVTLFLLLTAALLKEDFIFEGLELVVSSVRSGWDILEQICETDFCHGFYKAGNSVLLLQSYSLDMLKELAKGTPGPRFFELSFANVLLQSHQSAISIVQIPLKMIDVLVEGLIRRFAGAP